MINQLRHFAFTYNNYQKDENWSLNLVEALRYLDANYYIWGKEIAPSTGTPHLQGYVQLKKRKYFSTICKHLRNIHITIVRGSSQDNINYCKKVDTEYYEFGEHRSVARGRAKQKEDWDILVNLASEGQLDEIREHNPREYALYYRTWNQMKMDNMVTVAEPKICLWIYGEPGIGKSRAAWDLFPDAYPKMANKWWDGYKGQPDVVLDDLGTHMLFDLIKRWSDRYRVIGEVKGMSCSLRFVNFVITSNYSIRDLAAKSNFEVDEITIQAIQRRFVEVQALKWNEEFQDLEVLDVRHSKVWTLRQLYYEMYETLRFIELGSLDRTDVKKYYNIEDCSDPLL